MKTTYTLEEMGVGRSGLRDDAIPRDFIRKLIIDPDNAGDKSRVLSWLLRKWEEEQNDSAG